METGEGHQPVRVIRTFSNKIEPVSPDVLVEALSHDKTRAKVKGMIDDYVGSVTFQDLVMCYAGKEIDKRSLGTFKYWAIVVLTSAVTGLVGGGIAILLSIK